MAKYTAVISGDLDRFARHIEQQILKGATASLEESQEWTLDDMPSVRCLVQAYERFSVAGSNRVSLNVTMLSDGEKIYITAIAAGGSQAMFFKINTWGEEAFLEVFENAVNSFDER